MKLRNFLFFTSLILCTLLVMLSTSLTSWAQNGLEFIENKGQSHPNVIYEAQLPGGKVFLENNRWTFNFIQRPAADHHHGHDEHDHDDHKGHQHDAPPKANKGHAYQVQFVGAKENPRLTANYALNHYHNYFIGDDPSKWAGKVRLFEEVYYEELYDCVDMKIYSNANHMKYDFVVHPGGDAESIQLHYEGVSDIFIKNKELVVQTSLNETRELKPYAYQVINGEKRKVKCKFELGGKDGRTLTFDLPNSYNKDFPLVIDPELVFSSYTGSTADNWGYTATYDDDGHLYGGGIVFGTGYPTTLGVYDPTFNDGDCDIGITKFSPDGSTLIYTTYNGGSSTELPHSLVVNSQNQLVIMGTTGSSGYPTTAGAHDGTFNQGSYIGLIPLLLEFSNGSDIVLTILEEDGASLAASTFFGGSGNDGINNTSPNNLEYNYGDHARGEVIVDDNDFIYIGSSTRSNNISGTNNLSNASGGQDGLVAKFNPNLSQLNWFTYVGGSSQDAVYSLKVDNNYNIYACGGTQGNGFPAFNGNDITFNGGQADGFIVSILNNGNNFINGTYIGTDDYDQTFFIEIDEEGDIYVVGQTEGVYPVSPGVFSNPGGRQFIHKFKPDLTTSEWSTVFGSGTSVNISPTAFLVDVCGRIYVSGWGGDANNDHNPSTGSTNGLTVTGDAFQSATDGSDLYFFVLEKDADAILYATYFGAGGLFGREHVDGGTSRFDKQGIIYQAVCASCGGGDSFPTTPGVWSNENGSTNCNLGVIKFNFEPNIIEAGASAAPSAFGCAPYTVNFINESYLGQQYFWDFGDGSPISMEENPSHTFGLIDTYLVQLVVVDSASCNIADTAQTFVYIIDSAETILADFDTLLPQLCDPYIVQFTNNSIFDDPPETYDIVWDFGNGDSSEVFSPVYEYPVPGNYLVTLSITGAPPCLVEDEFSIPISIPENPFVYADFLAPDFGCVPNPVTFEAIDEADQYLWDLGVGDGLSEEGPVVEYVYTEPGEYEVTLITIDSSTCNISDTTSILLATFESPEAFFTLEPDQAHILEPINFTNLSTPDMIYIWDFGDGDTSMLENPVHEYLQTGTNTICLTVIHPESPCSDTYCDEVFIDNEFDLFIPTAFTPNGDGLNDSYGVTGFGVESFRMLIFNRWGEKVFQTNSYHIRWDGTYKDKPQDLGVFVYYVEAIVAGSRPYFEKGNVTLIR